MSEETYDSMPREDMEYSIASQLSYDYFDNNNDAEQIQTSLDTYLEGYTFDPEYSTNNASTFIRPDGTAIIAYRGTRPTNLDDINTDAAILAGQHRTSGNPHPRFVEAVNHYNFVKSKYDFVDLTGHSLGGTLADYVGRMNNERAVVFNPGESPFSLSVIPAGESNTIIYRTNTFDIVSFANSMYPHAQSIRVVPQTEGTGIFDSWLNSHSLLNFLPSQSMMPLSTEPDVIIPDFRPIPTQTQKQEYKQDIRFISNLCKEQPYLFECKRPKLVLKSQDAR